MQPLRPAAGPGPRPSAGVGAPSDWLLRWAPALPAAARVLDLACGRGRHARWLAAKGHHVTAIDRDADALAALAADCPQVQTEQADLETGPWPLAGPQFDLVLVTNYLWRPHLADTRDLVAPGGWLIWETFSTDQARIGRPANPDFLLRPGELLDLLRPGAAGAPGWRVHGYEDIRLAAPERFVQRIAGQRAAAG